MVEVTLEVTFKMGTTSPKRPLRTTSFFHMKTYVFVLRLCVFRRRPPPLEGALRLSWAAPPSR